MKIPLEGVERAITKLWQEEAHRSAAPRLELMTVVAFAKLGTMFWRTVFALACALGPAIGCGGARSVDGLARPAGAGSAREPPPSRAGSALSNVTRSDYAGSATCRPCHAEVASSWERSPMHRMTRDAVGADIRAPFDGTRFRFKSDTVVLERRGADRFMRLEFAGGASETYRLTRVIGGRTREDFAGVNVRAGDEEVVLPVSYVFATRTLRYKGYSVMVHERDSVRAGPVWSRACIFCHNTVPEMDRLLGAIAGPRSHPYQGEQVDGWLSSLRRESVEVVDLAAFAQDVGREMAVLGGPSAPSATSPASVAREAIGVVRNGFDGRALVEEGIGCEACHGGSRRHAEDPGVPTSFVPSASWLHVSAPRQGRPEAINHVCARCHQVLFSRYPFTWEGGRRDGGAGGSHINSGEGRDFLLGGCSGAMACTACHDPHGGGDGQGDATLQSLGTPAGNRVCLGCHAEFAGAERLRAHAHHDPNGAGGACIACHMPRKNMGLGGTLTRYHRIGSPTDAERVLGDRPLECALCHAERTARQLADTMESWWKVRYPRQRLQELYGSLDANVLRATLERGKPHEQAVAMAVLGEERARAAVPLIAPSLLSEYPLIREWAKRSLTSILGRCEVDLAADDSAIRSQAAGALCIGAGAGVGGGAGAAVFAPTGAQRVPRGTPAVAEDPED